MEFLDFKGLSEFFTGLFGKFATLSHKHKVADISDYTVDSSLSSSSTNPIQNKAVNSALSGKVPTSRTINGKALSSNISLTATDVGADASGTAETKANAVQANVNALNDEFSDHVENADIHFTATERTKLSGIATGANKYSHPNSGVTAGTYKSVTVNAQGHITGGSNPTTLAGYGITDAEAKGTAESKVGTHNTSTSAHSDIRDLITGLTTRLNTLADSDDTTLDQMSEVVAYIKSNKELIESITTSKINVSDIVNNLTTNSTSKVLSAAQGVAIKALIDALDSELDSHTHDGRYYTESEIDTKLSGKANTSHGNHVPATETANNAKFLRNDNTWQTVTPANIGAAASSHGTHVSYSSTAPVMDGTASAGTASTVARSDHKHPTDTSRASQSSLDSHTGNTTSHITSTERTNWNAAKTHADSAHAPSNAEKNQNAFSNVKVGDTTIAADTTTDTLTLVGSNVTLTPDATNDKVTIGITKSNVTAALGYTPPTTDTKYTHPTTSGNKHIPAGGSSGQILRWSADGTAVWGADNNSDTKATQTNTTTAADYRVVLSTNANDTTETNTLRKSTNFTANPSTGAFYAKGYDRIDITGQTLDINTLTLSAGSPEIMKYIEKTSGGAANITNIPVADIAFILDVELIRWASTTDYVTKQTFVSVGAKANEYVRYCTSGTWDTSWTKRVFTDNNTTYSAAGSSLGLVKSGGDVTISSGVITVNDDSHNHTIANIDDLQSTLDGKSNTDHTHNYAGSSSAGGSANSAVKWSTARNINGMSVDGSANRTNYGTCSTAASTAAKTVTLTGFSLVTGASVKVKFTVTNTASNPTLNVNSTGAKAIMYRGSAISAGYLAVNRVYEFVYDGTDWELVGDINTDSNTTYSQATSSKLGLVKIGYTESGKNYPVELNDSGQMYVNVPWTDNNTTYSNFVKSGSGAKAGLVPAPSTTAGTTKYLREDGTWTVPPNTTYSAATTSASGLMSATDKTNLNTIVAEKDLYAKIVESSSEPTNGADFWLKPY